MSRLHCFASAAMRAFGPTRIGVISPAFAASTTAVSELSSQGCATAVRVGGRLLQRAISASYFSCLRPSMASPSSRQAQAGAGLQHPVDPLEHRGLLGGRLHTQEALIREQLLEERQEPRPV